jgi:hypothetical protein
MLCPNARSGFALFVGLGGADDGGGDVIGDALDVGEAGVDEQAYGVCLGPVPVGSGGFDAFTGALSEAQGRGVAKGFRVLGHGSQRRVPSLRAV